MNDLILLLLSFLCICAGTSQPGQALPSQYLRSSDERFTSFVSQHPCGPESANHTCEWHLESPQLPVMIDNPTVKWPRIGAFRWSRKPATHESHSLLYGKLMVVCGMHARELFTTELCYDWIATLLEETRRDLLLSEEELARKPAWDVLVIPQANPLGRDVVSSGMSMYKDVKTRKKTGIKLEELEQCQRDLCHRGNKQSVDLNRNWITTEQRTLEQISKQLYEEGRLEDAKGRPVILEEGTARRLLQHAASKNRHLRYMMAPRNASTEENPGSYPMSEPETAMLARYMHDFRPDVLMSIHTGVWSVMVPPDENHTLPSNYEAQLWFANAAAGAARCTECRITRADQNLFFGAENCCLRGAGVSNLYRSNGTMTDYAYYQGLACYSLTFEVYRDDDVFDRERAKGNNSTLKGISCFAMFNPIKQLVFDRMLDKWRLVLKWLLNLEEHDQLRLNAELEAYRPVSQKEDEPDPYAVVALK